MMYIGLAILIIGGAVLTSTIGTIVIRKLFRPHVVEGPNDILVRLLLTAGVIYAVLLGFWVIAMLNTFEAAHTTTAEEASLR